MLHLSFWTISLYAISLLPTWCVTDWHSNFRHVRLQKLHNSQAPPVAKRRGSLKTSYWQLPEQDMLVPSPCVVLGSNSWWKASAASWPGLLKISVQLCLWMDVLIVGGHPDVGRSFVLRANTNDDVSVRSGPKLTEHTHFCFLPSQLLAAVWSSQISDPNLSFGTNTPPAFEEFQPKIILL